MTQDSFDLTVIQPLRPETAMTLPSFDPDGSCPKCGVEGKKITTVHHTTLHMYAGCGVYYYANRPEDSSIYDFPEHLCRTCTRCHFSWPQAVLSDPAESEDSQ